MYQPLVKTKKLDIRQRKIDEDLFFPSNHERPSSFKDFTVPVHTPTTHPPPLIKVRLTTHTVVVLKTSCDVLMESLRSTSISVRLSLLKSCLLSFSVSYFISHPLSSCRIKSIDPLTPKSQTINK